MSDERLHFTDSASGYNAMSAAEHMVRYHSVASLCRGKRVLDVACGEGYGSSLLAKWGALAAITAVFTINYVAEMLGEDEDWLYDLSIDMFAEDGCLRVYGVGEDGVTAFTEYGIECLKQIIADERATGKAPPPIQSTE